MTVSPGTRRELQAALISLLATIAAGSLLMAGIVDDRRATQGVEEANVNRA